MFTPYIHKKYITYTHITASTRILQLLLSNFFHTTVVANRVLHLNSCVVVVVIFLFCCCYFSLCANNKEHNVFQLLRVVYYNFHFYFYYFISSLFMGHSARQSGHSNFYLFTFSIRHSPLMFIRFRYAVIYICTMYLCVYLVLKVHKYANVVPCRKNS